MNKKLEDLIEELAISARNRIVVAFLLGIPPILLTYVFFPENLSMVLAILMLMWGVVLGIMLGILIVDSKIQKEEKMSDKKHKKHST
jgi:VIT1/CCC1 family predicted Fe2+/Mn2+ transporter